MPPTRRERPRKTPPRGRGGLGAPAAQATGYWADSMRPLHILVFLAPLILLYEYGSARYLVSAAEGTRQTILAQKLLGDFFELFGAVGLVLPGVALLTVLLIMHILQGDRWRVKGPVLGGMLLESIAWTLPLLVLAAIHSRLSQPMAEVVLAAGGGGGAGGGDFGELPWQARLTIAIGAGLYEEMLFRLVLIAALHLVLADLLGVKNALAGVLAVIGAAAAFALYHNTTLPGGGRDWAKLAFLGAAGAYLGAVYVLRGFGVVVGTHAVYDAMVLVVLRMI